MNEEKPEAIEGEIVNQSTPIEFTETKHDEITVKLLERAFHSGFNISEACQYAEISRETYYNWLADDDIFSYRMSLAQSKPNKTAKELVMRAINTGDAKMALRYLMLRDPDFKPKIENVENPETKEARDNLKGVLDAISKHDPGIEPPAATEPDNIRVVETDPTDIS